ncbi:AAA family ATPase [Microbacterium lacticum]
MLQGSGVNDIVFHDFYHGCVSVQRSVELWAIQEWGGHPDRPVLVVHLTRDGDLDFGGNDDEDAARALFDSLRNPRAPKYGRRRTRNGEPQGDTASVTLTADQAESARADGARAADEVSAGFGSGQGLVNRMGQITQALESRGRARMLVVVDELAEQFETLEATGQAAALEQARRLLRRKWLYLGNQVDALVVYLDPDRMLTEQRLLTGSTPGVKLWEIGGPEKDEIREALTRIDTRTPLDLEQADAIARSLAARRSSLRTALGDVARTFEQHGGVTLSGLLDLPPVDEVAAESVLRELDELVGLDDLKLQMRRLVKTARERRTRLEEEGILPDESLHLVFTGNPGTGKTTVARIVARLFHALGVLPTNEVREISSKDIKSEYVGETRTRMQSALSSSLGGVLFIDEAHQFGEDDHGRSKEAIDTLVPMAWNHRHELVVILAGYAAEMADVMRADPGLSRRFPESLRLEFHDYTLDQLWQVLERGLAARNLQLDGAAVRPLRGILSARASRSAFGNAGGVENLVNEIQRIHDVRVGAGDHGITIDDLPPRIVRHDDDFLEAQRLLQSMTGLSRVKGAIDGLRVELEFAEAEQDDVPTAPRFRFVGPPGTGKTTVARLIGQLLHGMGLLSRKHVVEVTGSSLKAEYVGHTSSRVRKHFQDARGGVLFIDEAYGMTRDGNDSFAADAMETLLAELTSPENRDTVVILAGYKPDIDRLMGMNLGLSRRVSHELVFESLSPDECADVARGILEEGGWTADDAFFAALAHEARAAAQSPTFGNAGWVGARVGDACKALARRVMSDRESYDAAGRRRLIAADLGIVEAESTPDPDAMPADADFTPTIVSLPRPTAHEDAERLALGDLADSVCHLLVTTGRGEFSGTGFVATGDNVVITNRHVVEGARSIEVLLGPTRGSASGRVLVADSDVDLAAIAVHVPADVEPLRPLPLAGSLPPALPLLRELVVVGNAQVRPGEEPRIVTAKVGRNQQLDALHFETDGAIEEGFSGGPLWDPAQRGVVGVVVGGKGRGVKLAIRAEYAVRLLQSLGYVRKQA